MTSLVAKIAPATAVVLVALLATAPAGAATKQRSLRTECETRGWKTLAANAKIRLFLEPFGATASACRYDRRGKVEISYSSSDPPTHSPSSIAGWFVATDHVDCARDGTCNGQVRLWNMRNGRFRKTTIVPGAGALTIARPSQLLVTVRGSVTWIRQIRADPFAFEVWVWPVGQAARRLDSVPEADSSSLAVGGGVVYWTNNGQPRSAPLP